MNGKYDLTLTNKQILHIVDIQAGLLNQVAKNMRKTIFETLLDTPSDLLSHKYIEKFILYQIHQSDKSRNISILNRLHFFD